MLTLQREKSDTYDTIVIGGGITGLSVAWHLRKEGHRVLILEQDKCGMQASWAAAGMLSAVNELEFRETEFLKLMQESLRMYPSFLDDIGKDVDLRREGTLTVGVDADDFPYLRRSYEYQKELGLDSVWLEGKQISEFEAGLSPKIEFGFFSNSDIQLDNRLLTEAVKEKCLDTGVRIHEHEEATELIKTKNKLTGIKTVSGKYTCSTIVAATGIRRFADQTGCLKIHPVRGQVIELELADKSILNKVVRLNNKTLGFAYLVPKRDRLVCGGTAEEMGMDTRNTAGAVMDILRKVYALVPGLYDLPVKNIYSGLRPATLDAKPVIGNYMYDNLYVANGMYRHGILLAPVAGKIIADLVSGRTPAVPTEEYSPYRFN